MSSRTRALLAVATMCAALAVPTASASAEDFCVGDPAGCTGTGVPAPLLSFALKQAQSNGTDDRFFIAPGVFASSNFTYQSGERVQIVGAGAGKTILTGNLDGPVLELGGDQDASVSDLTIEPTGTATSGLKLVGARARGVAVVRGSAPSLETGVQLYGDATFDDGSVDIGTLDRFALLVASGAGTVTDSTLTAPAGAGFASLGSDATLRRSTLDAKFGAVTAGGHLTVSDTLVDLRGHAGGAQAYGLYTSPNSGGTTTATTDADRLTIVGSTPATSETVAVGSLADGAGKSANIRLRDSVISGIGVPAGRQADNGATANLTTSRSAYPSALVTYDTGAGSIVEESRLKVSPSFVGNGDFHLAAHSPLIDAASPDGLPPGATDRDGRPRASDGDGDCAHAPDIGAFEYQGTQARAVATPAAVSVVAGQPLAFSAAGSCVPGPEAPTIHWGFDDGATAAGATATHAFQAPGRHTVTVTVTDDRGHSAQTTAGVDVTAPATTIPAGPVAPRITHLRVAPTRVQIGSRLPKLVRTAVERPLATINLRLSKPATVMLRFAKLTRNGKARALNLRIKARQGENRIRFAARLTRRVALKPGNYRLTAVANDKTGVRSKPARTRFSAIKPVRR